MVAPSIASPLEAVRAEVVGRESELAELVAATEEARAGIPTMTIIHGEPGTGKSTMLRAAIALAGDVTTLSASGSELERLLDLGIVDQLRADAGMRHAGSLSRRSARPEPFEIGRELIDLVVRLSSDRPVLLAIDDAQWADEASLRVVSYVIRRLRDAPVHVVLASRPDAPHLAVIRHLARDRRGRILTLRGLTPGDVRELVRRRTGVDVPVPAVRRLHEHTGGNPLYCVTLAEESDVETIGSSLGPLRAPREYASFVLDRLASCAPDAELVVEAIAVLGRRAELADVARMVSVDDLAAAVSEAVERGLLRLEDAHGVRAIDVAHPLVRAAVLEDASPSRRSWLERRAAAVTPDPDRALLHRLRAVVGSDPALAGEAIARARHLLDIGWDGPAVDLLVAAAGALPHGDERDHALLSAADRLVSGADTTAAAELVERIAPEAGGAVGHLVRGRLAMLRGDIPAAERAARAALECDAEASTVSSTTTCAAGLLATIAANRADADASLHWARVALGAGAGDDTGHALTMLAGAWTLKGRLAQGRREVRQRLAARTSITARADGDLALGLLALWSGRHDEAERRLRAVAEVADRCPWLTAATAAYSHADTAYRLGRWDEALDRALALGESLDDRGRSLVGPMVHGITASVLAGRGDTFRALEQLRHGERALDGSGAPAGRLWLRAGRARVAAADGDHQGVVDALAALARALRSSDLPEGVQPWQADLAEALIGLHRLDDAAVEVAELTRRTADGGAHARIGARRAAGLLAAAQGDLVLARDEFSAGLDEDVAAAGSFAMARLELAAGAVLRRRGWRREAADLLERAVHRFADLQAEPYRVRAEGERAQCGRARRTRLGDRTALTPAERAVARLVSEGRTNREVAAQLVVSVKTVESHLSRIFAKLGVRSRTELAHRWDPERSA